MTIVRTSLDECRTNKERVLFYLAFHGPLTPAHASIEWHDGHLASRVDELRGEGWEIDTEIKYAANGKRYAEYSFSRAQALLFPAPYALRQRRAA